MKSQAQTSFLNRAGCWMELLPLTPGLEEGPAVPALGLGALLTDGEQEIRSLAGAMLPAAWQAVTTTSGERQQVTRLMMERVVVTVDKASERVNVELHGIGSLSQCHTRSRPGRR
jgi:hypothetical protein